MRVPPCRTTDILREGRRSGTSRDRHGYAEHFRMKKFAVVLLAGFSLASLPRTAGWAQVNPFPKAHDMLQQASQATQDSRNTAPDPAETPGQKKPKAQNRPAPAASRPRAASAAVSPATALVRSAGYGKIDEVKAKLEAGASLQTVDGDGNTMLHSAASHGQLEMVQFLLGQKGIEIDARDKAGDTPLSQASYLGRVDVVKELIDKGADLKSKDGEGRDALQRAAASGYPRVVTALLAAGADSGEKDLKGSTALDLTQHYRQREWQAVELLLKADSSKR